MKRYKVTSLLETVKLKLLRKAADMEAGTQQSLHVYIVGVSKFVDRPTFRCIGFLRRRSNRSKYNCIQSI